MLQNCCSLIFIVMMIVHPYKASANDYYRLQHLEFFKKIEKSDLSADKALIDWREPMVDANGKITYYQPPQPVLNLLNVPNQENAREYLRWQQRKTEQIIKAQEVLMGQIMRD